MHQPEPECALVVGTKFRRGPGANDVTVFQNKSMVGNLEHDVHVLLAQQDRCIFVGHSGIAPKDLLNDQRRKACAGSSRISVVGRS
jgi:hypothetical protein